MTWRVAITKVDNNDIEAAVGHAIQLLIPAFEAFSQAVSTQDTELPGDMRVGKVRGFMPIVHNLSKFRKHS